MCVGEKLKNVKQSCVVKTWKKIFSNFDFFLENMKKHCAWQLTMQNGNVQLMSFTSLIKRTTTKSEDMQKAMGKKKRKLNKICKMH